MVKFHVVKFTARADVSLDMLVTAVVTMNKFSKQVKGQFDAMDSFVIDSMPACEVLSKIMETDRWEEDRFMFGFECEDEVLFDLVD